MTGLQYGDYTFVIICYESAGCAPSCYERENERRWFLRTSRPKDGRHQNWRKDLQASGNLRHGTVVWRMEKENCKTWRIRLNMLEQNMSEHTISECPNFLWRNDNSPACYSCVHSACRIYKHGSAIQSTVVVFWSPRDTMAPATCTSASRRNLVMAATTFGIPPRSKICCLRCNAVDRQGLHRVTAPCLATLVMWALVNMLQSNPQLRSLKYVFYWLRVVETFESLISMQQL